jgi:4-azaleucine resistance transporter AzlC
MAESARHRSARELRAGMTAVLPLLIGVAPFALIYGVLARGSGLSPAMAQAMSLLVFAGAAQFLAVGLIGAGVPWPILLLTTGIINLRHVLYSASLAPHLRPLGPLWKWILAFLTVDEVYALAISRYQRPPAGGTSRVHWYYLGAGLMLWATWQSGTAVGIYLGARVPSAWGLEFTLPLTFIGLLVPALTDSASRVAAVTAGVVAVLAWGLPLKLGLIVAALAGIVAGMLAERAAGGPPES